VHSIAVVRNFTILTFKNRAPYI